MTNEENIVKNITSEFLNVNSRKKGDIRSPHKIFLILIMLARYSKGLTTPVYFEEICEPLIKLLEDFGPPTKKKKPNDPFFHLLNDGIWVWVDGKEKLVNINKNNAPTIKQLTGVSANFTQKIHKQLLDNFSIIPQIVNNLISNLFPESFHDEILESLGITLPSNLIIQIRRARDPNFRLSVLKAYDFKCVVCGFSLIINNKFVGLESAHIKWHESNGPDEINNGLSMCSLHHKMFDRGVFTLDKDSRKWVFSSSAHGISLDEQKKYHNQEARKPIKNVFYPKREYIEWHENEVFIPYRRD
jgi:putative restriction endonuclease